MLPNLAAYTRLCSICGVFKGTDKFSKSQLRKKSNRKCKSCAANPNQNRNDENTNKIDSNTNKWIKCAITKDLDHYEFSDL